jgi:hypothetical protein
MTYHNTVEDCEDNQTRHALEPVLSHGLFSVVVLQFQPTTLARKPQFSQPLKRVVSIGELLLPTRVVTTNTAWRIFTGPYMSEAASFRMVR